MIEDICDGSQSDQNVNIREACYKIRYRIKQRHLEWKGPLKFKRNMGKVSQKLFKTVARFTTFGRIWFRSFPFHSRSSKLF